MVGCSCIFSDRGLYNRAMNLDENDAVVGGNNVEPEEGGVGAGLRVLSLKRLSIRHKDVRAWLNDEVINHYSALINQRNELLRQQYP